MRETVEKLEFKPYKLTPRKKKPYTLKKKLSQKLDPDGPPKRPSNVRADRHPHIEFKYGADMRRPGTSATSD